MEDKQYIIGFSTKTGLPVFWGEYADTEETRQTIEKQIVLNYGNKHCYIIVSERAYRNLKLGLDKTKELVWAQNDLFEANQFLQKAMKTIKEVVDKP